MIIEVKLLGEPKTIFLSTSFTVPDLMSFIHSNSLLSFNNAYEIWDDELHKCVYGLSNDRKKIVNCGHIVWFEVMQEDKPLSTNKSQKPQS